MLSHFFTSLSKYSCEQENHEEHAPPDDDVADSFGGVVLDVFDDEFHAFTSSAPLTMRLAVSTPWRNDES